MRAPRFWNRPPAKAGLWPIIFTPAAAIWRGVTARRLAKGPRQKLSVPVVCIGNINIGGTGKTPTTLALQSQLLETGIKAHVVSRGYGGSASGPLRVDERLHSAAQVGDEPLLMAAFGPVWVAKDRAAGAKAAIKDGAQIILLDDGFQNPALHHDLSIVVVDAGIGFGNGRVIPAGPLREPLKSGLARTDVLVAIGDPAAKIQLGNTWPELALITRFNATLTPLKTGMDWQGLRVVAFAGIGRPAKFFETLKAQGAEIISAHEFTDHAEYSPAVLQRLKKEAAGKGAQLVTTEKDAIRLPKDFRSNVLTLPVRLQIENATELLGLIKKLL